VVSVRALVAIVISSLFGAAIVPGLGGFSYLAITPVFAAVGLLGWMLRKIEAPDLRQLPIPRLRVIVWLIALLLASWAAAKPEPILYLQHPWVLGRGALIAGAALVVSYATMFRGEDPTWVRHARFGLIAAAILLMGIDTIAASPAPEIDVWTVQQRGAEVLSTGGNPFEEVRLHDTGPRTADDVPYVYPPLHLIVSSVAWNLLGDVRYAMVLAVVLAGFAARALARKTGGDRLPAVLQDAPALLIWFTPCLPFILEQAWIDPIPIALFSALTLCAERKWLGAVLAGLVIGTKQTMVLVVFPLALAFGFGIAQWAVVAVFIALPIAPWAMWNFAAWKHSNFDFLNALPVRDDALTLVTWAKKRLKLTIPPVTGFLGAAATLAWATWSAWRRHRPALEQAALVAVVTMTSFFVFNKWAFANYYFTLLSLAALAAAAALKPAAEPPP
jgi:hypothetical protein